jgi:hypothetical protein
VKAVAPISEPEPSPEPIGHERHDDEHDENLEDHCRPPTTGERVVVGLGHEVVARSIEVGEVAEVTGRERPDGDNSTHALELIGESVRQAACPVITLLETDDHDFVTAAAKRGVFAYITDTNPDQLQDSIEIVLRRFAEFQNLEGAFGRRAVIERAKGILMERHDTTEDTRSRCFAPMLEAPIAS